MRAMRERDFQELDVRGLEPPEPLVRILNHVECLSPGESLRTWTDRRPLLLIDSLSERGYTNQSEPRPEGGYVTTIVKN